MAPGRPCTVHHPCRQTPCWHFLQGRTCTFFGVTCTRCTAQYACKHASFAQSRSMCWLPLELLLMADGHSIAVTVYTRNSKHINSKDGTASIPNGTVRAPEALKQCLHSSAGRGEMPRGDSTPGQQQASKGHFDELSISKGTDHKRHSTSSSVMLNGPLGSVLCWPETAIQHCPKQ